MSRHMWPIIRDSIILLIGLGLVITVTIARSSLEDLDKDVKASQAETFANRVTTCRALLSSNQPLIPGGPCSEWPVARLLIKAPVNVITSQRDVVRVLGPKDLCDELLKVKAPIEKECRFYE